MVSDEGAGTFVDEGTAQVLGVASYRERLTPDSDAAQRQVEALRHFGPAARAGWQTEMAHLRATETWADGRPEELDAARAALAEIPRMDGPLRRLETPAETREPLPEVDLFRLKRFCFYGAHLFERAPGFCDAQGATDRWADRLADLVATIHPGGEDHARFHLAEALDPRLEQLREELRRTRKTRRTRRDELEAAITAAHGGSFDLRGHYLPADDLPADDPPPDDSATESPGESPQETDPQVTLEEEPRLEHRSGAWQLADDDLQALDEAIEELRDRIGAVEREVRAELTDTLAAHADWLARVVDLFRSGDLRLAKVRLKRQVDGCWPEWAEGTARPALRLEGARHPRIVERARESGKRAGRKTDRKAQPIDVRIGERPVVLTGPNMGGKSALLEVVGLAQWCAQHAMPVPADLCVFRSVHAVIYVGSEEPHAVEAEAGLSSFGREVHRIVDWQQRAEAPSLWLLDEVGRGTHPEDGAALARQIVEQLHAAGHTVVAATHFPALASLADARTLRIRGLPEDASLEEALAAIPGASAGEPTAVETALRRLMDYQPVEITADGTDDGADDVPRDVPRDARRVAAALGLKLKADLDDDSS